MEKINYTHDCDACVFLGSYTYFGYLADDTCEEFTADLYICRSDTDTLIARVSSEGRDYSSGPPSIFKDKVDKPAYELSTHGPAMVEAYKRWLKWKKDI